jgi:hypothetical protein
MIIHPTQTITGGIPGTREERTLSWTERSTEDGLFGFVTGKSRYILFLSHSRAFQPLTNFFALEALPGFRARRGIPEEQLDCGHARARRRPVVRGQRHAEERDHVDREPGALPLFCSICGSHSIIRPGAFKRSTAKDATRATSSSPGPRARTSKRFSCMIIVRVIISVLFSGRE